jgi:hypothetical protein
MSTTGVSLLDSKSPLSRITSGLMLGDEPDTTSKVGSESLTLPILLREAEDPEVAGRNPNLREEDIPEEAREEPLLARDGAVATLSMTGEFEELAGPTLWMVDILLAVPGNEGEEPGARPTLNKLPIRPDALREEEPNAPPCCEASKASAGASPTGDGDKSAGSGNADEVVEERGIPPAAPIMMLELALEACVSSGPELSVLPEALQKS